VGDSRNDRTEGLTLRGQLVLYTNRCLREHGSTDDALCLKFFKPLGKHTVAHFWNHRPYISEAVRATQHRTENNSAPPSANEFDGLVKKDAEAAVGMRFVHIVILPYVSA